MKKRVRLAVLAMALCGASALAQDNTAKAIQEYRDALQDGNPAELWEAKGEDLWKQLRGPNKVSLEKCDVGLGAGVVKGAYARLPKYFKDTDRVDDLESRLVHCMVNLQGFTRADVTRRVFGGPGAAADMEALVAYVTSQSKGVKMNVALNHSKEREAFQMGQKLFNFRGGPHDFACATCHGEDSKRIRLCRIFPTSPNRKTLSGPTPPGLPIAFRRGSCAHSSGVCTIASASSAFPRWYMHPMPRWP